MFQLARQPFQVFFLEAQLVESAPEARFRQPRNNLVGIFGHGDQHLFAAGRQARDVALEEERRGVTAVGVAEQLGVGRVVIQPDVRRQRVFKQARQGPGRGGLLRQPGAGFGGGGPEGQVGVAHFSFLKYSS